MNFEDMIGPKIGTWSVFSESDPRWNMSGRGYGLVCEGGPEEMKEWIKKCVVDYGDIPKDATMSFYKD